MILQVQVHRCVPGDDGGAAQLYKLWQHCSGATRPLGAPRHPGRKKMIRCRPGRRSQPGHVRVPPLGEWKALRRGQTNHRCPNHEEAGPLEGKDGLLLSGQVGSTPRPGGWREQRRRRRRRKILQVTVLIFQKWTLKCVPTWTESSVAGLDWDRDLDWDQDWDWDLDWSQGPAEAHSSSTLPPHSPATASSPPPHSAPSQSQTSPRVEMRWRSRGPLKESFEPGRRGEEEKVTRRRPRKRLQELEPAASRTSRGSG